jgi:mannitol/fructose-specific phosphotransferase system IIA component (Ntr-type)
MLRSFITRERIYINPRVKNRDELFRIIAEDALKHGLIESPDALCRILKQREAQGSTELEPGIAIPHAKFPEARKAFAYAIISKKGIRWGGPLSGGARIIFLLGAAPEDENYLAMMAHVARLLRKEKFKEGLLSADVADDVLHVIRDFEEIEEAAAPGKKGMHAIFLLLNEREMVDTAMSLMVELGVKEATIVDSLNIKSKMAFDIPFLGFLSDRMKRIESKILIGIAESPDVAAKLYTLLKAEGFDLSLRGKGTLFSFPLGTLYGGLDEDFDF